MILYYIYENQEQVFTKIYEKLQKNICARISFFNKVAGSLYPFARFCKWMNILPAEKRLLYLIPDFHISAFIYYLYILLDNQINRQITDKLTQKSEKGCQIDSQMVIYTDIIVIWPFYCNTFPPSILNTLPTYQFHFSYVSVPFL